MPVRKAVLVLSVSTSSPVLSAVDAAATASPVDAPPPETAVLERIVQAAAQAHLNQLDPADPLVLQCPPGVWSSEALAHLGSPTLTPALTPARDIAFLVPSHAARRVIPSLQTYRQIEGCTPENCDSFKIHKYMVDAGYSTLPLHKQHRCRYIRQFTQPGSAVFAGSPVYFETSYPWTHPGGIVIDGFDPANWAVSTSLSARDLRHAATVTREGPAQSLLIGVAELLDDSTDSGDAPLSSAALFNVLDAYCEGQLSAWVTELAPQYNNSRSRPAPPESLSSRADARQLPPVVLPHLVRALAKEIEWWRGGRADWNGCIRLLPSAHRAHGQSRAQLVIWRSALTTPQYGESSPPLIIHDAVVNERVLARLLGRSVTVREWSMSPPSGISHVHLTTPRVHSATEVRRFQASRDRMIRATQWGLQRLRKLGLITAEASIGLVSYPGAFLNELGEALGVPAEQRVAFWQTSHTTTLRECDVVFVIGTPRIHPNNLERLVCVVGHEDDEVVRPRRGDREDNTEWRQHAPLIRELDDYLSQREVTLAAHLNDPWRHDGRVVVTLSDLLPSYLPVTQSLDVPERLAGGGKDVATALTDAQEARLEAGYQALLASGKKPSGRALSKEAHVHQRTAVEWLRGHEDAADIVKMR